MDHDGQSSPSELLRVEPDVLEPAVVEVRRPRRRRRPSRRSAASPRRASGSAPRSRATRLGELGALQLLLLALSCSLLCQSSTKTATFERSTSRVERLEDVVDGAAPSSRGRPAARPCDRGEEDDRDVRVRSRCLISSAVSKPSMPGICTSSRITREVVAQQRRSASSPEVACTSSWPSGSRIASSASRFSGRSSTSRTLARVAQRCDARHLRRARRARGSERRDLLRAAGRRGRDGGERGAGISGRGRLPGPARSRPPPRSLIRGSPARAVVVGAGEDDADGRSPYASAADSKRTSIDGRRTGRAPRSRARSGRLDEQVVVGRREVDVPRLDRLLVVGLGHAGASCAAASSALRARRAASRRRGAARPRRRASSSAGQPVRAASPSALQPAPRGADDDELARITATFR